MQDNPLEPEVSNKLQQIRFAVMTGQDAGTTRALPDHKRWVPPEERFEKLPPELQSRYRDLEEAGRLTTLFAKEYTLDWLETTRQLLVYLREIHRLRVGEPAAPDEAQRVRGQFLALPWPVRVDLIPTLGPYHAGSKIVASAVGLAEAMLIQGCEI